MATTNDIFIYIFVFILIVIVIGFFFWSSVLIKNYNLCVNNESSYCPNLYCDTPSASCDNLPYRFDSEGNTVCAYYLLEVSAPLVNVGGSSGGGG
jgi:hypothetical protein